MADENNVMRKKYDRPDWWSPCRGGDAHGGITVAHGINRVITVTIKLKVGNLVTSVQMRTRTTCIAGNDAVHAIDK